MSKAGSPDIVWYRYLFRIIANRFATPRKKGTLLFVARKLLWMIRAGDTWRFVQRVRTSARRAPRSAFVRRGIIFCTWWICVRISTMYSEVLTRIAFSAGLGGRSEQV